MNRLSQAQAEAIVSELVQAAYDCGYYSGRNEDGSSYHERAIARRSRLRRLVIDAIRGDVRRVDAYQRLAEVSS